MKGSRQVRLARSLQVDNASAHGCCLLQRLLLLSPSLVTTTESNDLIPTTHRSLQEGRPEKLYMECAWSVE